MMKMPFLSIVGAILVLGAQGEFSVARAQSAETFLSFVSEPGDYIGGGQSLTFTPGDASGFSAMASQDNREIAVTVFPLAGSFWFLHLAAPAGQELVPGIYEGATRWPLQLPSEPGLDFSGDGRGCNTLTGRFEVREAVYGPFGYIERFHATFEQHCEGAEPALFGEIQIINPPPPPALTMTVTIDKDGTVKHVNGVATIRGTVTCSSATTANLFGSVMQRASRFALATGSFNLSVSCSTASATWSAVVSPGGSIPFGPGPAQVDVHANAFDPNYGTFVQSQDSGLIQLIGGRR